MSVIIYLLLVVALRHEAASLQPLPIAKQRRPGPSSLCFHPLLVGCISGNRMVCRFRDLVL